MRLRRSKPVMLRAELRNCHWDADYYNGHEFENVVEEMPVYYNRNFDNISDPEWRAKMHEAYSPARYVADCIALTRNIAATWDLVKVTLDAVDVTEEVNEAWQRYFVSRRHEFA